MRELEKAAHPADVFDVKADMLAALEAAIGAADDRAGESRRCRLVSPRPSGTLALGPKYSPISANCIQGARAFDLKGPVAAFEIFLDAIPEPKAKGKARAAFAPSPYQAVERDFAFVVDAR